MLASLDGKSHAQGVDAVHRLADQAGRALVAIGGGAAPAGLGFNSKNSSEVISRLALLSSFQSRPG
jgi:hypothetical protein